MLRMKSKISENKKKTKNDVDKESHTAIQHFVDFKNEIIDSEEINSTPVSEAEELDEDDMILDEEYLEDSDSSLWNINSKNDNVRKKQRKRNKQKQDIKLNKVKRKDSLNVYICEYCNEKFNKLMKLNSHKKEEHPKDFLTCVECTNTFKSLKNLKQHRVIHRNKGKDFVCEQCGASFIEKRRLNLHKLIHLEEKPIKCEICTRTFAHRSNYTRHLVVHAGVRPFACPCGRRFSNSTKLKYHKQIHLTINEISLCDDIE